MPVNCAQLSEEDIRQIMEQILYEFPVSRVEFYMPKWVEMLPLSHPLKTGLIEKIRELTGKIRTIRDVAEHPIVLSSEYVRRCMTERIDLADGCVRVLLDVEERYYYEMLSEYAGEKLRMRRSFCTHCACFPAENRNTTALRLRWRRCIQRDMEWCCRAGRKSIWSSRRSSGMETSSE